MLKNALLLLFTIQFCVVSLFAQIPVGSYIGIDYATAYTNPSSGAACLGIGATNSAIGDADFVNGAAEISLGWSFSGTWNSGASYTDGPGSEVLLVSLHTYTETWSVALRLSDGSTTAFSTYALTIVTDNAVGSLQACDNFYAGPFDYERPSQELDFATYSIPPGIGVIGIIFEPLSDGAADPDPHGVLILQNTPILEPGASIDVLPACFGSCNGSAEIIDGPNTPYTYQWDASAGNVTSQSISNLCAGSYTVYVTDSVGTIDTLIAVITENPEVTLTEISVSTNLCFGQENGVIQVIGGGGDSPYLYSINGSSFNSSTSFDSLSAGVYTLFVQDAILCSDSLILTIEEGAPINVNQSFTSETCLGECNGTVSLNATGDQPLSYSINNCVTNFPNGIFTDLCAGNYSICIEDVNGCAYSDTLIIAPGIVTEIPSSFLTDTVICIGEVYNLIAPNLNPTATTYSWNNGAIGSSIEVSSPGIYILTMSNLCNSSSDSVTIDNKLCDIEAPNIISLAEGSQNPIWFVKAEGLSSFNLVITNRWGGVIFECNDVNAQCFWNGTDKNGNQVKEGVYFYTIDAALEGSKSLQKHGFIQVVD